MKHAPNSERREFDFSGWSTTCDFKQASRRSRPHAQWRLRVATSLMLRLREGRRPAPDTGVLRNIRAALLRNRPGSENGEGCSADLRQRGGLFPAVSPSATPSYRCCGARAVLCCCTMRSGTRVGPAANLSIVTVHGAASCVSLYVSMGSTDVHVHRSVHTCARRSSGSSRCCSQLCDIAVHCVPERRHPHCCSPPPRTPTPGSSASNRCLPCQPMPDRAR
ncbi:hypothetical protein C2E23DRAFT_370206 [Lenzites betulinus]|nr:hypothetical protein C2E23DRAFT_370206 [Lenzites betulinus]